MPYAGKLKWEHEAAGVQTQTIHSPVNRDISGNGPVVKLMTTPNNMLKRAGTSNINLRL